MIKLSSILGEGLFDVAPGISLKDIAAFYAKVEHGHDNLARKVSRLIQDGKYEEAKKIIEKVLKTK